MEFASKGEWGWLDGSEGSISNPSDTDWRDQHQSSSPHASEHLEFEIDEADFPDEIVEWEEAEQAAPDEIGPQTDLINQEELPAAATAAEKKKLQEGCVF
jgi:hypothetical protein